MTNSIFDWSTTAASNGASDSAVPFPENMNPSQVNDSARALMGRLAELLCDLAGVTAGGAGSATTTGTANTYALTTVAGWTAYRAGLVCSCLFNIANTGASTINVNGTGAKALTNRDGGALLANQITGTTLGLLFADGTGWRVLNVDSPTDLGINPATMVFGPFTNLASASTTDLSSVATVGVTITGNTTINNLGSGAGLFRIGKFAGALQLTYNATSMILPGGVNINTAAGDTFEALSDQFGNWTVTSYTRASGLPIVMPATSFIPPPTLGGL